MGREQISLRSKGRRNAESTEGHTARTETGVADMSPCYSIGNLTICRSEGTNEDMGRRIKDRWCFVCRKRVTFEGWAFIPKQPSYYDPTSYWKCPKCGGQDTDLFPGWSRYE